MKIIVILMKIHQQHKVAAVEIVIIAAYSDVVPNQLDLNSDLHRLPYLKYIKKGILIISHPYVQINMSFISIIQ